MKVLSKYRACVVPLTATAICLGFAISAENRVRAIGQAQTARPAAGQPGQNINDVLKDHFTGDTANGAAPQISIAPMTPENKGNPTLPPDSQFTPVDSSKIYDGIVNRAGITNDKDPASMAGNPGALDTIDTSYVLNSGGTRQTFGYFIKVKYPDGEVVYYFALFSFDKINTIGTSGEAKPLTATEFFLFGGFKTTKDGSITPNPPELEYGLAIGADGKLLPEVPLALAAVANLKGKNHANEAVKPGVEEPGQGCLVCHARKADGMMAATTPFPWIEAPKEKPKQQASDTNNTPNAVVPAPAGGATSPSDGSAAAVGGTGSNANDKQSAAGGQPGATPAPTTQPPAQTPNTPQSGQQQGTQTRPQSQTPSAQQPAQGTGGASSKDATPTDTSGNATAVWSPYGKTLKEIAQHAGLPFGEPKWNTGNLREAGPSVDSRGIQIGPKPEHVELKIYGTYVRVPVGADWEVKSDGTVVFTSGAGTDFPRGTIVVTQDPDGKVSVTVTQNGLLIPADDKRSIYKSSTESSPKLAPKAEPPKQSNVTPQVVPSTGTPKNEPGNAPKDVNPTSLNLPIVPSTDSAFSNISTVAGGASMIPGTFNFATNAATTISSSLFGGMSVAPTIQLTINGQTITIPLGQPVNRRLRPNENPFAQQNLKFWKAGRMQPVAYHRSSRLPVPSTILSPDPASKTNKEGKGAQAFSFSLVASGNLGSKALELQASDPTGQIKQVVIPAGVVLEPLKPSKAKVSSGVGGGAPAQQLTAYCLEIEKQPPEPGQRYRIAPQALQDKFKPLKSILEAGSKLAEQGKFHPDSEPGAYNDFIRQHAMWAQLENWSEQKFTEVFVERTKKNAALAKISWTKEMEQALRGAAPGRWRDISMVLDEAQRISGGMGVGKTPQL